MWSPCVFFSIDPVSSCTWLCGDHCVEKERHHVLAVLGPGIGSHLPHPSPVCMLLLSVRQMKTPSVLDILRLAWCLVLLLLPWAQGLWGQCNIPALHGASSAPCSVSESPTVLALHLSVEKHQFSGVSTSTPCGALDRSRREIFKSSWSLVGGQGSGL